MDRIHRADEDEAGGEDGRPPRTRDPHEAVLERLWRSTFERMAAEPGHLVEKSTP